jgi:ATP-binding cassette subfamily A (ABC1) protein 3
MFNPSIPPPSGASSPPNFVPYLATPMSQQAMAYAASSGATGGGQGPQAAFIPASASGLNALYNVSTYMMSADCNNTDIAAFPAPNWALIAEDVEFYNLTNTWQLSRFLLDAKNGTNPISAASTELPYGDIPGYDAANAPFNVYGSSTYGAYVINAFNNTGNTWYAAYTALVNTSAYHAAPVFVALMDSALFNWVYGGNASISVINAPLPFTKNQSTLISTITSFIAVLFIVIAFSFIPASFAVFIVKETEVKAKHQQLLSGVSIPAYWCSTYAWDIINYLFPCIAAIILIVAFGVSELVDGASMGATILLFFFYGTSVASFTYLLTYLYKSHSSAQTMTLIINLLCVILLLASFVMQQITATCPADASLKFIYRLLPGFSLGNGLMQLSLLKTLPWLESDCGRMSIIQRVEQVFTPYSMQVTGYPLLYMILQSVIYFLLAMLIDVMLSFPAIKSRVLPDKDVPLLPYEEDDDVTAEADRVDRGDADNDVIRLQHLRKVYAGGKLAVKNLTFGIPQGEVFGFLGINGAGKTTTLKMLSGDEIPTKGTATLGSFDILREQMKVRRLLGYCPQFDALLDLLTTREHLELFARIKGVPEDRMKEVVDAKLKEMDLVQYANKLAGSLSGGNKRKLSVAIAMIGDPPLIFLDEPSTGMDPVARRFMWNVISRIATERQQCSIILTTHSMEECEALCTRVGIMVGGRLRCLGPIQHLKNKFGRGFMAVVKLSHPTEERVNAVIQYAQPFIHNGVIPMTSLAECCRHLGDPSRFRMIHPSGSGWSLAAALQRDKW